MGFGLIIKRFLIFLFFIGFGTAFAGVSKKELKIKVGKTNIKNNSSVTRCTRQGVPNETGSSTKFLCAEGAKKFLAYCDLAVDPMEFNQSKLDIQQAQWKKHAKKEGIEGSFGFISCKKR